jgi:hypothetical protein
VKPHPGLPRGASGCKQKSGLLKVKKTIELDAIITCPQCGFAKEEQMPPAT